MRFRLPAVAAITAWLVSAGIAQKITSLEEFSQGMKTIGASVAAAGKAIGSGAYPDAKAQLVLARQMLASSVPFWLEKKNDDAAKKAREAVRQLDALDKLLSATAIDSAATAAALKDVGAACGACHNVYREGDQQTGYRMKNPASP